MSQYEIHQGSLYDYTAGTFCGVLVTESVMKKLASLQAKHLEDVKRMLSDESSKGNVYPSSWTLHHPNGKQTTVHFIEKDVDVVRRIKAATTSHQPQCRPLVFIAESMDQAKQMADARCAELAGGVL